MPRFLPVPSRTARGASTLGSLCRKTPRALSDGGSGGCLSAAHRPKQSVTIDPIETVLVDEHAGRKSSPKLPNRRDGRVGFEAVNPTLGHEKHVRANASYRPDHRRL